MTEPELPLAEAMDWPLFDDGDFLYCAQELRKPDKRTREGYRMEFCGLHIACPLVPAKLTARTIVEAVAGHMMAEHWKPGYPVGEPPGPPEH